MIDITSLLDNYNQLQLYNRCAIVLNAVVINAARW